MNHILGIHHVAMKCCSDEEIIKVKNFYTGLLELPLIREWDTGFMFDTGNGLVEVFTDGVEQLPKGTIRHFAFKVDDVDFMVDLVKKNGFEVFMGPKDICLGKENKLPARVAFCYGPIGEEVEFFEEKNIVG